MPVIRITVEPHGSPQRVFNASQLAAAVKGKKATVPWNDDEATLVGSLWEAIADKAASSVKIDETQTSGMKARLAAAKIKKRVVPGTLGPGRYVLEVRVLDKPKAEDDEDGPDRVPIPVEIDEPPDQPEKADFQSLVREGQITFGSSSLKSLVERDKNNADKAAAIFERGTSYKGHGTTESIGGLHAHVTNRTALGFKWSGGKLLILGVGEKNDSAAKGNSGYDWTT